MTHQILTQSTLILQPTLRSTAAANGITAAHIKKCIVAVKPTVTLPSSRYKISDQPSCLLPLISTIVLTLLTAGLMVWYFPAIAGNTLESLINSVNGIIATIHSVIVKLFFVLLRVTPHNFLA